MAISFEKKALLILAHGSSQSSCASISTKSVAAEIERRALFASVHCAFWKEEPGYHAVWPQIEEREVFVVPHFISEGYFTREIIPRELGLEDPTTQRDNHLIHYCPPVGLHPGMTDLIVSRATEATTAPLSKTSLLLVGHGTERNPTSSRSVENQVKKIREMNTPFAEVVSAYLDESPNLSEWASITSAPNVIVVPFLISEGIHTQEDIPCLLNQNGKESRLTQCTAPIGTDPAIAGMIIDQAANFNRG